MKKIIFALLFVNFIFAQETEINKFNFKSEFRIALISRNFFGDNYLSKGHKNMGLGAIAKLNIIEYNNFKIGVALEKSSIQVSEFSKGGLIAKTNLNAIFGSITYQMQFDKNFNIEPQISYSSLALRQKNKNIYFGRQRGISLNIGIEVNYKLNKAISVFSILEFSKYNFNVKTTPEFESYFDNSKSVNISLGIKL